jgi:hypothetical protein
VFPQGSAAKAGRGALHLLHAAFLLDHRHGPREHPARLRRQFIEAPPQHLVRKRVRAADVLQRRLDVLDDLSILLCCPQDPLVLVQQRDRIDQGQILLVIAPRAGLVREERQAIGVGV